MDDSQNIIQLYLSSNCIPSGKDITKLYDLVRAVDNYTSKQVKLVDSRYFHVDTEYNFIEARIVRQVSAGCSSLLNTEFAQVMLCMLTVSFNSFTDLILGVNFIIISAQCI